MKRWSSAGGRASQRAAIGLATAAGSVRCAREGKPGADGEVADEGLSEWRTRCATGSRYQRWWRSSNSLQALQIVGGDRGQSFALFSRTLNLDWVRRALAASGTASVRRRKLPAESVVWLVIGMALLRDRSIDEVVRHLDLVLPESAHDPGVSHSAVIQARERLGCEPLAMLFGDTARHSATAAADTLRWRGLAVYGVDGTTMRIADTTDNEIVFGRPRSGRSAGAYPQLRLVALMVLRAHLLRDWVPGSYDTNEQTLARELWRRLPERCVVVIDKGFINYAVFHFIQSQGAERHWLCRAKANLKWEVVRPLGPHDDLVRITINRSLRKKHPELPEFLYARAIGYHRRGFRPQILLTSLLDPTAYPATEIIELYHERWELELGFDGEYDECCVWGLGPGRSCPQADGPSEGGGVRPREE